MLRLDHHQGALRVEGALDGTGHLRGQALLDLQASGVALDEAGQLGEAGDHAALLRYVGHVGHTEERQEVVLAERVDGNVADHDHLVVVDVELLDEVVGRILVEATAHLGVHAGHPGRGIPQPVAGRVLADGHEDLGHRGLDPVQVDREVHGLVRWRPAHDAPPSVPASASGALATTRMSGRFRNRSLTSSP